MIAVVKQADVPALAQAREEFEQGAGAFGKFETIEYLVLRAGRAPADQVADMQLGHFIVGEVDHRVVLVAQILDQGILLQRTIVQLHTREHLRLPRRRHSGS